MPLRVHGKQRPGGVQMGVMAQTGERIEHLPPLGVGVQHAVCGQQGKAVRPRRFDEQTVPAIFAAPQMICDIFL